MEIIEYNSHYQKQLLNFIKIVFEENEILLDFTKKHTDILNPLSVYFSFFIVVDNNNVVGCVGVRTFSDKERIAEMKRLYLLNSYHGYGIGGNLVKKAIKTAADKKYQYMRLDTKEKFSNAVALIKKYGFYKIERYNNSSATLFYEIKL